MSFHKKEQGTALVEYALVVALAGAVCLMAFLYWSRDPGINEELDRLGLELVDTGDFIIAEPNYEAPCENVTLALHQAEDATLWAGDVELRQPNDVRKLVGDLCALMRYGG